MTCVGDPQPELGRCWKSPSESWSLREPRFPRLVSRDSCIAVATAMTQARGGIFSCEPVLMMMAAFRICAAPYCRIEGNLVSGLIGPPLPHPNELLTSERLLLSL